MPGLLNSALDTLGTVSDRLIAAVAPGIAVQRFVARARLQVANAYTSWQQPRQPDIGYGRHGASSTKRSLVGWFSRPGNADEDVVKHLDGDSGLRARSRDLWMGTPIARGGLRTKSINVIGAGLRLSPQIDADYLGLSEDEADAWERETEREWLLWAESHDCDAARQLPFGGLQALAYVSAALSGDVFALLPVVPRTGQPYDLRVQLAEADRVCDPWPLPAGDIVGGIECGEHGDPVAYHFAKVHPAASTWSASGRSSLLNEWIRVPAYGETTGRRQVLHVMPFERPEQRRGVPLFAPVMEALKQLGRYTEAELDAALVTAMLTVFITSENPTRTLGKMADGEDGSGTDGASPVTPVTEGETGSTDDRGPIELGPGTVAELEPGEKVETVNPMRPNTAFDPFVRSVCVQLGAALGVPYEVLLLHFTTSYTAARAALLQFWKGIEVDRSAFAGQFCQPTYEEWLTEAVARGRIAAPGFFADPALRKAWCGAEWYGPAQGLVQEGAEVEAAHKRVRYGFSTMEAETASMTGRRWHNTLRVRSRELAKQREAGTAGPYESARPAAGAAGEA